MSNKNTNTSNISKIEKKNQFILARDVALSNDGYATRLNGNVLCIGSAGSGKTTGLVAPNLNNAVDSIVVQDTKCQLFDKFHKKLFSEGYKVFLVDFVNPENSHGYNPLEYIRRRQDGTYVEKDIKKLATLIMPTLDASEPFWEKAASRYIAMLIAFTLEALPEEEHTLMSVVKLHQNYNDSTQRILLDWAQDNPESYAARKYKMLCSSSKADKMWNSIMEFANEALDPFDCAEFRRIFEAENTIDLHQLSKEKCALFINVSDNDSSYGVLANTLNAQLIQTLLEDADKTPEGRLPVPCRIILDDFAAAAGQIPDFDKTISVIRSRGISVSIMVQSISQLNTMYGEDKAKTICNNCDTIMYLGGGHDLDTANLIAHHANMTQHSVFDLPLNKAILIQRGHGCKLVDKIQPTDAITGLCK